MNDRWKFGLSVIGWYCVSTTLSAYNKYLFTKSETENHSGWTVYPIASTSYQMLVQFVIIACYIVLSNLRSDQVWDHLKIPELSVYCALVIPTAMSTSLDIGLSNLSLSYVSLSTYTVIKSTAPLFVLLSAVVLGVENTQRSPHRFDFSRISWRWLRRMLTFLFDFWTYGVVILGVIIGIYCLAMDKESHRSHPSLSNNSTLSNGNGTLSEQVASSERKAFAYFFGMILVLIASFMSGIRWALTQKLLQNLDLDSKSHYSRINTITQNLFTGSDGALDLGDEESEELMKTPAQSSNRGGGDEYNAQRQPQSQQSQLQQSSNNAKDRQRIKIYLIYLLTPLMCIALIFLSLMIEKPFADASSTSPHVNHLPASSGTLLSLLYLSIPAPLAIMTVFLEFTVLSLSSPFQLSLMGMVKECFGVLCGLLIFKDVIGVVGWIGICFVLLSVWLHHFLHHYFGSQR
ncbi:hypothetical protein MP228_013162 [Amoeboaphelidium protococcarum]|nr:hypothetical protein MP228_013162 [Amoeboaphelidium protococcarum]